MKTLTLLLSIILSCLITNTNAQDWPNLERYRSANENLALPSNENRVVFMGNSITDL